VEEVGRIDVHQICYSLLWQAVAELATAKDFVHEIGGPGAAKELTNPPRA